MINKLCPIIIFCQAAFCVFSHNSIAAALNGTVLAEKLHVTNQTPRFWGNGVIHFHAGEHKDLALITYNRRRTSILRTFPTSQGEYGNASTQELANKMVVNVRSFLKDDGEIVHRYGFAKVVVGTIVKSRVYAAAFMSRNELHGFPSLASTIGGAVYVAGFPFTAVILLRLDHGLQIVKIYEIEQSSELTGAAPFLHDLQTVVSEYIDYDLRRHLDTLQGRCSSLIQSSAADDE